MFADGCMDIVKSLPYENVSYSECKISAPNAGGTEKNMIIEMPKRKVFVRFYDDLPKLETGNCLFEVEALNLLSAFNVPHPIKFKDFQYIFNYKGKKTIAYEMVNGKQLSLSDLTKSDIEKIGIFLSHFIGHTSVIPIEVKAYTPHGDCEHIGSILQKVADSCAELQQDELYKIMVADCHESAFSERLKKTPQGIVHADFFDENIMFDGAQYHLIDFGDTYFGAVVNDIIIGAMEFSVIDNVWNFEFLEAVLKPSSKWLRENNIDCALFEKLLRINCVRFFCYVLNHCNYENHKENPYYIRYKNLIEDKNIVEQINIVLKKLGVS